MYYRHGGFQHPNGEVLMTRYEVRAHMSPRGDRWKSTHSIHIVGEVNVGEGLITPATQQADLSTKIAARIDAYNINDVDSGLHLDDGTPTRHYLYQNPGPGQGINLSGVKVVNRSWPRGAPEEYATCRTFAATVSADFQEEDSGLIAFEETVRVVGTGGPEWRWVQLQVAPYRIQQIIKPQTTQTIIQEGFAVGLTVYPLGNVPAPLVAQWEHQDLRVSEFLPPSYQGNSYRLYPYRWRYVMETPPGFSGIPATP